METAPVTVHERRQAARQAMLEGRHEDALRELVWFHEHALEEAPAMYGVRLSYALFDWVELGKVFPPARQALEDIRDRKAQTLLRGEGDRALFHDVEAINDRLDMRRATYELYLALDQRMPELAKQCARLALPAIVEAKDYRLADRVRPQPEAHIRAEAAGLDAEISRMKHERYTRAPRRWAAIFGYARLVRLHRDITAGIGDPAAARRLEALAVKLIRNPSLRLAVRTELAKRPGLPRLYRRGWARVRRRMHRT
jgi:hypothetical protein